MRYNVIAQDANLNEIRLFNGIDKNILDEFLNDYCTKDVNPWDSSYRWLKDYELTEYNIPYSGEGWIIRFNKAETA